MLSFESSAFPVAKGEDEETNPGIFGRSLAEWISSQLTQRGIATAGVIAEDFAWCVSVPTPPYKLYVACASADEKETSWQVIGTSSSDKGQGHRTGFAVGGAPLEPFARAGAPDMKRLHPLSPDTRRTKG